MLHRIAVGVDLEPPSVRASHWAARAFGQDVEVMLVHCLNTRAAPPFLQHAVASLDDRVRTAGEDARTAMERLAEKLPSSAVSIEIRRGRPADELAAAAAEYGADLVVVGEQGPRQGLRGSLGSSASQLPMVSPVPVLVKRHLPERQPQRILAAVDHSGASESVLEWTAELSRYQRRPGEVVIHMSLEAEWSAEEVGAAAGGRSGGGRARLTLARDWLAEKADEAKLRGATVDVSSGDPRYEILAVQRRYAVDLVVVGRRGGGEPVSAVIGSVADTVLHSASCSVLVV